MPFITFIYRIGKNKNTYYGKYVVDYISDDHDGLDDEIRPILINGINSYRKKYNKPILDNYINIGILSFSSNQYIPTFSSDNEKKCFDFYCEHFKYKNKIYVNGEYIE